MRAGTEGVSARAAPGHGVYDAPVLAVSLFLLAVFRATRLVTADAFPPLAAARRAVIRRFGDEHPISYLVECPWCVSVWLGALGAAAWDLADMLPGVRTTSVPVPVALALAASLVTGAGNLVVVGLGRALRLLPPEE